MNVNTNTFVSWLVVGMLLVPGVALMGTVSAEHHEGYVVEQGDQCIPVEPVSGTETGEEFYDYRGYDSRYSSHATQEFQDDDTSTLVLHEGPDGLSLVVVHDQWHRNVTEGTRGATISFEVSNLPADGEWVVEDDDYSGQSDEFVHGETKSELHWVYGESRTDGAVFTGLGSSFAVEIDPRFNRNARLTPNDQEGRGEISDWQVITTTEDGDGFERASLDSLSEPVTVRPGSCTDDADAGVPVDANADLGYGIELASVWVTTDQQAGRFDASVTQETNVSPPVTFADERTFALATDDHVETLTATVRVDRRLLEIAGLEPDDIVLFSHTNEEWTTVETTVVETTDDAVYVRGETDAEATIGIGASAPVVTAVDVDEPVAGEPFDVQITFGNPGLESDETTVAVLVDGEEVAETSTAVSSEGTAEAVVTTTVEEEGNATIVVGGFERPITLMEATRELSIDRVYVADDRIEPGETAEIVAVVENTGTATAEYTVNLTVSGGLASVETATIESGNRTEIRFQQSFAESGTYEVGVGNVTRTVAVGTDATGNGTERSEADGSGTNEGGDGDRDESIGRGIPDFAAVTTVLMLVLAGTAFGLRGNRRS